MRRVVAATKSGMQRYPRALYESVRYPFTHRNGGVLRTAAAPPDLEAHPLAAMWLGHATVLVRMCGVNILTDPVFSSRIGVTVGGVTIGLPRLCPMPYAAEHLPEIDLVLVSHAHFDHLDRPTLRGLVSGRTVVVTARRTRRLIPPGFGRTVELDWGQDMVFKGLRIEAVRPAHWGARTALDRRRGYNSYVIREDKDRHGVLLTGDTALTDAFEGIDALSLAVFGIGSYEPWEHAHATPEQAWRMFRGTGAARFLPVHHSTFPLGDEGAGEPMRRLLAAAGDEADRVIIAEPGAVWAA
jgi:L-ascorbate metabolism protein UlaG (beta-lactamase superfamily)